MVKPHLSVFVCLQGEQLRGFLQLQVFHPLPGLLAGVLSVHRGHRAAVLHKILDSEYRRAPRPLRVVDAAEDADSATHRSPPLHPLIWLCMVLTSPLFPLPSLTLHPPTSLFPLSVIPGPHTLTLCSLISPSAIGNVRHATHAVPKHLLFFLFILAALFWRYVPISSLCRFFSRCSFCLHPLSLISIPLRPTWLVLLYWFLHAFSCPTCSLLVLLTAFVSVCTKALPEEIGRELPKGNTADL